jgi:hypothetical protein
MSNQTQPLSHRKLVVRINILLSLSIIFLPFALVWSTWFFTAMSFELATVFNSHTFWCITAVYEFAFAWCAVLAVWESPKPINRRS